MSLQTAHIQCGHICVRFYDDSLAQVDREIKIVIHSFFFLRLTETQTHRQEFGPSS